MTNLEVELTVIEEQTIFGLSKPSNDRTVAGDVRTLSAGYHDLLGKASGEILPFFVLSRNYDEASGDFELSVGGLPEAEGRKKFCCPPVNTPKSPSSPSSDSSGAPPSERPSGFCIPNGSQQAAMRPSTWSTNSIPGEAWAKIRPSICISP